MAIKFPIIGAANESGRRYNLLFVPNPFEDGKHALSLCPGLRLFCDTGENSEVRGLCEMDDVLYAVVGNKLFSIDSSGSATEITNGDAILTKTGHVTLSPGNGFIFIADGTYGYSYKKSTNTLLLLSLDDHYFSGGGPGDYYHRKWVSSVPDSYRFTWSEISRLDAWGTSADLSENFQNVDEPEGNLLRVIVDKSELIAFKRKGILFYDRLPSDQYSFRLRSGTEMSVGLRAPFAVAKLNNTFYWLGDDLKVYMAQGYIPQVISTIAMHDKFARYGTTSDAFAIAYTGTLPYFQLTFPTEGKTWLYDAATGYWSRLTAWHDFSPAQKQHRANCHAWCFDKNLVGDYRNGKIYQFDSTYYQNDGHAILWKRRCHATDDRREYFSLAQVEVEADFGIGLLSGQGADPQMMMRYSVDGGHNWSDELWEGVGARGDYGKRAIWGPLGQAMRFDFEFSGSDPVPWKLIDGYARPEGF